MVPEQFAVHDFVFVNHSGAPLEQGTQAPRRDERDERDEKSYWVARVLEIAAIDARHVYLRVFWAYWPDELPGGRRPYHGANELVVSNHMDIVDAHAVAGRAQVMHWRELDDDDNDENPPGLFWRQKYTFQNEALSVCSLVLSTSTSNTTSTFPLYNHNHIHIHIHIYIHIHIHNPDPPTNLTPDTGTPPALPLRAVLQSRHDADRVQQRRLQEVAARGLSPGRYLEAGLRAS